MLSWYGTLPSPRSAQRPDQLLEVAAHREVASTGTHFADMTNTSRPQRTFTSKQAVALFREHTSFEFHPAVPGTLLARAGIQKIPSTSRPVEYDAQHWALAWDLMIDLANQRCRYDRELKRPRNCIAPAPPLAVPVEPVLSKEKAIIVAQSPSAGTELEIGHALRRHPTRKFIVVAFAEEDEAKRLGALWEPLVRKWYVPAGLDRKLFRWPDALLPPAMYAIRFPSDKPPKRPRQEKSPSAERSTISNRQIHRTLDARLDFLLDKPD